MRLLRQTSLPISLYGLVHYLGQRYILYNRRANTRCLFTQVRGMGILRSSQVRSSPKLVYNAQEILEKESKNDIRPLKIHHVRCVEVLILRVYGPKKQRHILPAR